MNIWLHWFCLPWKHNIPRQCLHEKAFWCDRNRWSYWSIETPVLLQHLVQWFYSELNVVQATQQNIPMYRIWDSPNDQPLIWIHISPCGHEYACLQLELIFLFYFLWKESRSEPMRCKACPQTERKERVSSFSACSLEYLLQAEVLQEKRKEVCPHQQGVGGQTTSWQELALREELMEF